ncbi:MAG: molybdenum cofactor biosynthesis protein MoaE [Thaumarchaeota archaeon]|nr:molybdenum cofactor biosynthesis protein MoaE [Nitrososphaerota archaeon]
MTARITQDVIDPARVISEVSGPEHGAVALFLGTVRDNSQAGRVDQIIYEAYVPMAEKKMLEIERELGKLWPGTSARLLHRVGTLSVGEVSVAVAVSSPHRAEAFEACRHAIERIKHDVPIWKKERLADGSEVWVEGSAMGRRGRAPSK